MSKRKLDDKEIRKALISRISTYKDCTVFEELTVPSGKARADVVAVNGHVVAYEIKSDFDSIKRLKNQLPEYEKNFEMNYIVVGSKFANSISDFVPDHWGIIIATKTRINTVRLSFIRKAKLNPNHSFKDFLFLLSSYDIKRIASKQEFLGKQLPKSHIRGLFKQDIIKYLDNNLTGNLKSLLKKEVRQSLKKA